MPVRIGILEPESDQAIGLVRLLKRVEGDLEIYAIIDKNTDPFRRVLFKALYGNVSSFESAIGSGMRIVPTGHRSTTYLLTHFPELASLMGLSEAMLFVANKRELLDLASTVGISVPEQIAIESIKAGESRGPFFYKEVTERGGGRRGVGYDIGDLPDSGEGLFVEEYINTPGTYGVAFYAVDGVVLAHQTHFESISMPEVGGSAVALSTFQSKELVSNTRRLVESLTYSGWGLAEYKWSETQRSYVLMEINGKLWASSEFSFLSNPDLFFECFGMAFKANHPNLDSVYYLHRIRDLRVLTQLVFSPYSAVVYWAAGLLLLHAGLMRAVTKPSSST